MRFYMQQVKALRGVPGNHCPSHSPTHRAEKGPSARALTRVVEKQDGGGRTLGGIFSCKRETLCLSLPLSPNPGLCAALGAGVPGGL